MKYCFATYAELELLYVVRVHSWPEVGLWGQSSAANRWQSTTSAVLCQAGVPAESRHERCGLIKFDYHWLLLDNCSCKQRSIIKYCCFFFYKISTQYWGRRRITGITSVTAWDLQKGSMMGLNMWKPLEMWVHRLKIQIFLFLLISVYIC